MSIRQGVYILLCANKRYYIGSTNNLERRLLEHRGGLVNSTRNILPIKLVFFKDCKTLVQARQIEYQLKKKKSKVIVEQVIRDGFIKFFKG